MQNKSDLKIPKVVLETAKSLKNSGFDAYLVGGCVRDLLLGKKPKDWDIATNAVPEEIINIFDKTFYENPFGTVGVVNEEFEGKEVSDETLKIIEITPYRTEGEYLDYRRPNKINFGASLEEDLSRRDFTINSIALDPDTSKIIDPFEGQKDIKSEVIKAVGNPKERFTEDGLRILRAIRISSELSFTIDKKTQEAIKESSEIIKNVSKERIRDEFLRIIASPNPVNGLIISRDLGVLAYFLPELEKTIGVKQNQAHSYDVWTHLMKSLEHSAKKNMDISVRLAALFHDISKPETRRWSKEKNDWTFYGHDVVGSRVTENILKRLRFPMKLTEKVVKLVRWHMFFSDTDKITLSAVRRIISKVGKENIWDLVNLRLCDRIGTGRPKESPYRLRKYQSMIEEVFTDPISVSMLKINGAKVIEVTRETPGPRIGYILHALLEEVLDNPDLNTEKYLEKRAHELSKLPTKELEKVGEKAKEKKEEKTEKTISKIRGKYWVK